MSTTTATPPEQLDQAKLEAFVERIVLDAGTAMRGGLSYIGDRLGIFKALADGAPVTPAELAERTGLNERYLREWLGSMATAEYVEYDAAAGRYRLPPEHALPLADEEFPFFTGGLLQMVGAHGDGRAQGGRRVPDRAGRHPGRVLARHVRGHRAADRSLVQAPSRPDLDSRAARRPGEARGGRHGLDVGCGSGRAPITIAKAFPDARGHRRRRPRRLDRARPRARRGRGRRRPGHVRGG